MEAPMSSAEPVTDHEEIRRWAEKHGGRPAKVETGEPGGILRLDFGRKDEELTEISWDEFFEIFDENDLALLLQEGDRDSRFNKFIQRGGDRRQ
jgi:hypothetical protein